MSQKESLWPHVAPDRLAELNLRLKEISRFSPDFVMLVAGSTVIATLGLFQNSPAVIIGAMIIAPLMRPLVGLSLATLTADSILLTRALGTLLLGTIISGTISFCIGSLLHAMVLTPEILGRTRPNLLDMGVALFAGAIGAYCQANSKLSDTLAGVAISVALVPPLSVVGIGLSIGSTSVWTGAALLYATNLVGITFAGTIVFLCMGYTPLTQARKGLMISGVISLLLMIPLGLSMRELILENNLSQKISSILKEKTYTFKGVNLKDVEVRRFKSPMSVTATVYDLKHEITSRQVKLVQDLLERETGSPIEFHIEMVPVTEITATEVTPEGKTEHLMQLPPTAGVDTAAEPDSADTAINSEHPGVIPSGSEATLRRLPATADDPQAVQTPEQTGTDQNGEEPSGTGQEGRAQTGSAQAGSAQAGSAQAGSAQAGSSEATQTAAQKTGAELSGAGHSSKGEAGTRAVESSRTQPEAPVAPSAGQKPAKTSRPAYKGSGKSAESADADETHSSVPEQKTAPEPNLKSVMPQSQMPGVKGPVPLLPAQVSGPHAEVKAEPAAEVAARAEVKVAETIADKPARAAAARTEPNPTPASKSSASGSSSMSEPRNRYSAQDR